MVGNATTSRKLGRLTQGLAAAFLIAFFVHSVVGRGTLDTFFNDWVYNALVLVAAVSALLRGVRVRTDRAAWLLIGAALALWAAAEITSTVYVAKLAVPPYPSISDAMWIAFYPASYVALVLLVRGTIFRKLPAWQFLHVFAAH